MKRLRKSRLVIVLIIAASIILFDITPFGGNIRFYAKWIECGQKPVVAGLGDGLKTGVPHYTTAPSFAVSRLFEPKYYCTATQAEQLGYSANADSYSFPHLERWPYDSNGKIKQPE